MCCFFMSHVYMCPALRCLSLYMHMRSVSCPAVCVVSHTHLRIPSVSNAALCVSDNLLAYDMIKSKDSILRDRIVFLPIVTVPAERKPILTTTFCTHHWTNHWRGIQTKGHPLHFTVILKEQLIFYQLCAHHFSSQKTMRWHLCKFYVMVNITMINTWIMYN